MQHVKPGDLVAWPRATKTYFFLIGSKSAFFGCQWAVAFHGNVTPSTAVAEMPRSFFALIDFIEPRRANALIRVASKLPVNALPSLERMKAWVDYPPGPPQWYIYDAGFRILEKRTELRPGEESFPIASGMGAARACSLIDSKWLNANYYQGPKGGNFPL